MQVRPKDADDALDDTSNSTAQQTPLPQYWLNVRGVVSSNMPALIMGEKGVETVFTAGKITRYFHGGLSSWKRFNDDVLNFWIYEPMLNALQKCDNLPVWPDPDVEKINRSAMTVERIQCGGEVTTSGMFYSNALQPVIHCVETMGIAVNYGPRKVTSGDAWIRGESDRVPGQQPDIIGKIRLEEKDEVRLLGEVKFPLTVDIANVLRSALTESNVGFRAILVVNYMLSHRLRYAFLTNYQDTIFLQLYHIEDGNGKPQPRIMFSDPISYSSTVDAAQRRISVRLALLYLVYKTFSQDEAEWQISRETLDLTNNFISGTTPSVNPLNTPFGNRSRPLHVLGDGKTPEGHNDLITNLAHSNPFAAPKLDALPETPSKAPSNDPEVLESKALFFPAAHDDTDDLLPQAGHGNTHQPANLQERFIASMNLVRPRSSEQSDRKECNGDSSDREDS